MNSYIHFVEQNFKGTMLFWIMAQSFKSPVQNIFIIANQFKSRYSDMAFKAHADLKPNSLPCLMASCSPGSQYKLTNYLLSMLKMNGPHSMLFSFSAYSFHIFYVNITHLSVLPSWGFSLHSLLLPPSWFSVHWRWTGLFSPFISQSVEYAGVGHCLGSF